MRSPSVNWGNDEYGEGFKALAEVGVNFTVETIARALVNIYKGEMDIDHEIEEHLFQESRRIFQDAIDEGYTNAVENNVPLPDNAFREAILHSADVFSAFRTHRMQKDIAAQLLDAEGHLKPFSKFVKDVAPYIEHRNRTWLQTEYDTAVIRAQNAAEWNRFEQEKDVFPNLEWLQSTSPDPGADHMIYWGTIRPVDDPFWNEHRPGDRWNCKCRLKQTEKEITPTPNSDTKSNPNKGLESNPGKAKELFSQKHSYYPQSCASCPFAGSKLMALARGLTGRKNCNACKRVDKAIDRQRIIANRKKYERLKKDPDYTDVAFDPKTGGVKATHKEHNFDPTIGRFGIPRGNYEKITRDALFKKGYNVILRSEKGQEGVRQPDGYLDGILMDIKGVEGLNCSNSLKSANRQKVKTVILYYHDKASFDINNVNDRWEHFPEFIKNLDYITDKTIYLKKLICIVKSENEFEVHEIKKPE